jgi:hypothetical protein
MLKIGKKAKEARETRRGNAGGDCHVDKEERNYQKLSTGTACSGKMSRAYGTTIQGSRNKPVSLAEDRLKGKLSQSWPRDEKYNFIRI